MLQLIFYTLMNKEKTKQMMIIIIAASYRRFLRAKSDSLFIFFILNSKNINF